MQQSLSKRKAHSSTELKEKALRESSGLKMEAKANENEYGILATQIRLRVPYLSLIPMLDPLGMLLNWYSSQFRVPVSISTPEPASGNPNSILEHSEEEGKDSGRCHISYHQPVG